MTFPNNKLKNPYYFIKNNIVYEISDKQDADNCGQHYVTYQVTSLDGDDKVFVKNGDKYLDANGTPTIAQSDGYYPVSTGKLDIEANKAVFPWICVKYKENATDTEIQEAYFWLDYLIDDGDTFDGTMFIMNSNHAPEDGSYIEYYKATVLAQIGLFYANGYTDTEIKRNFPDYMFAEEYGENITENSVANITINGKKAYLVDVTTSAEDVEITISEEDMINAFYTYCNEQVVAYANRLLKRVNKKLAGTTDEQIPLIVSEDAVVDIEDDTQHEDIYWRITMPTRIQGGMIKINGCDDNGHVLDGTHITIIASPAKDYALGSLTVDNKEVENPYEFDIHSDITIGVTFVGLEQEPGFNNDPEIIGNDDPIDNLEPTEPIH